MEIIGTILLILSTNWVNEAQIKTLERDPTISIQQRQEVVEETFVEFTYQGEPIRLSINKRVIEAETLKRRYVNSSETVSEDPFKKTRGKPTTIEPVKVESTPEVEPEVSLPEPEVTPEVEPIER